MALFIDLLYECSLQTLYFLVFYNHKWFNPRFCKSRGKLYVHGLFENFAPYAFDLTYLSFLGVFGIFSRFFTLLDWVDSFVSAINIGLCERWPDFLEDFISRYTFLSSLWYYGPERNFLKGIDLKSVAYCDWF